MILFHVSSPPLILSHREALSTLRIVIWGYMHGLTLFYLIYFLPSEAVLLIMIHFPRTSADFSEAPEGTRDHQV